MPQRRRSPLCSTQKFLHRCSHRSVSISERISFYARVLHARASRRPNGRFPLPAVKATRYDGLLTSAAFLPITVADRARSATPKRSSLASRLASERAEEQRGATKFARLTEKGAERGADRAAFRGISSLDSLSPRLSSSPNRRAAVPSTTGRRERETEPDDRARARARHALIAALARDNQPPG